MNFEGVDSTESDFPTNDPVKIETSSVGQQS